MVAVSAHACAVPADTLIVGKYKLLDWALMQGSYTGRGQQGHTKTHHATHTTQYTRTTLQTAHTTPPSPPSTPSPASLCAEAASRLSVEVRDPRGALLVEQDMTEEGQFGFTSSASGEHQVCVIAAASTSYYGGTKMLRCQLVMDFGEQAVDYSSIAKAEHLSAIEVEVRKLSDKVRQIRQEQDYQKQRESAYRDNSEGLNASVMYWSIAQTALLVAAGLLQLYLLTRFFKSKKLA